MDNENIFSAARKFLIRLGEEMLRATDEPCFFFAVRVIMQESCRAQTPILEFSNRSVTRTTDRRGGGKPQAGFKSSFLDPEDARRDPQEIPDGLGDQSPEIPGAFGDLAR